MHALLTKEKKKKKKKRKKKRKKNLCIACKVHRHVAFAVPMAKQGQIWHYRVNPGSALTCKISSRSLHRVAKTPNFTAFQLQHSAVAPTSGAETKLNASAQLQTFPYLTVPKFLLHILQRDDGRIVSTIFVISKRDGQKLCFSSPQLGAKSEPNQPSHGNRGRPYHSCTSKMSSFPMYSFGGKGAKIWGNAPANFKPPELCNS